MNHYHEIDNKPPETILIHGKDGTSLMPKSDAQPDYSPRLQPQSAAQMVQQILSTPEPVPQREPAAIRRERIEGANEKSTPIMRALASMIRSAKYLALVVVLGLVVYVAVPSVSGIAVTGLTVVSDVLS